MKALGMLSRMLVFSWIVGLASSSAFFAQEASVTAEVSPNPVGVDEQVSLTITVVGGGAERPQIPKISGLKLVGGPSVSNQFQWINGQSSSSQSFTYILLPEAEGTVKLHPSPLGMWLGLDDLADGSQGHLTVSLIGSII